MGCATLEDSPPPKHCHKYHTLTSAPDNKRKRRHTSSFTSVFWCSLPASLSICTSSCTDDLVPLHFQLPPMRYFFEDTAAADEDDEDGEGVGGAGEVVGGGEIGEVGGREENRRVLIRRIAPI